MTRRQKAPAGPHPDWIPFLDEVRDCHCGTCMERRYAASLNSGSETRLQAETAAALLAELRAGEHVRRERDAYIAEQRAKSDGGRGFLSWPLSDLSEPGFRSHCGVGFGSLK